MRPLFEFVLWMVLCLAWMVFGMSMLVAPGLVELVLWVLSTAVIIETAHILEWEQAQEYRKLAGIHIVR